MEPIFDPRVKGKTRSNETKPIPFVIKMLRKFKIKLLFRLIMIYYQLVESFFIKKHRLNL
jgi:hypothetical protein